MVFMAVMIGQPTKAQFSHRVIFANLFFHALQQITDLCHRFGVPYIKHTDGNMNSLLQDMISAWSGWFSSD